MTAIKIAIQGIRGAFHEAAARKYFGDGIEIIECDTFEALCQTLHSGQADEAIMAIENTIAGSILSNYSLIHTYNFHVTGEVYLNIRMHLLTLPGVTLDDIKYVESHPMALMQCQRFLKNQLPSAICRESNDTAESARQLQTAQDKSGAVICSAICAELYDLEIKAAGIETHQQNFTRFLVLSPEAKSISIPGKASLRIQLGNEIGSLSDILAVFKRNNINLSKIQSIPIVGLPYEYNFHIDVEWEQYELYSKAIEAVRAKSRSLDVLGEYTKGTFELNK